MGVALPRPLRCRPNIGRTHANSPYEYKESSLDGLNLANFIQFGRLI